MRCWWMEFVTSRQRQANHFRLCPVFFFMQSEASLFQPSIQTTKGKKFNKNIFKKR